MVHQSLANRPAVPSHKVPSQKLPKGMQQTVGRDKEIEALNAPRCDSGVCYVFV